MVTIKKSEYGIMASKRPKARRETDHLHWRPARGPFTSRLSEDPALPTLQEDVVRTAASHLKVLDDEKKKEILRQQLKQIVRDYWELRHDIVGRPPQRWYRTRIKDVGNAANKLLTLIREDFGTALMRLARELPRTLNLQLRQRSSPSTQNQSIENILEGLKAICDQLTVVKRPGAITGKSGAKNLVHIKLAVTALIRTWESFMNVKFPITLTAADNTATVDRKKSAKDGGKSAFTSPGPYFVQVIMQLIDPDVTVSQIATALRSHSAKT